MNKLKIREDPFFRFWIAPTLMVCTLPLALPAALYFFVQPTPFNFNWIAVPMVMGFFIYSWLTIRFSKSHYQGPINIDGVVPKYAANGFQTWLFSVLMTIGLNYLTPIARIVTEDFLSILLVLDVSAIVFCAFLLYKGHTSHAKNDKKDLHPDLVEPEGSGFVYRFFRGMEHHPRILGVDIKQLTNCRIGMVMWQILILLFGFYSIQKHNLVDYGLWTNVVLQTIYIAKFFYWETGYFNTLDITLDRAGFYLCWGCLFFLPTMYTPHSYYLSIYPSDISFTSSVFIFVIGLISIMLNYWVDVQKQDFFEKRGNTTVWGNMATFIETKYVQNGKVKEGKLLTSGFWGVARKINYTFELLLAFSWCIVGYKRGLIPFIYFIYLSVLLIHRIWRDEEKCFNKYGQYWVKYCKTVKYRMIPGFY